METLKIPSHFQSLDTVAKAVHMLAKEKGWHDGDETDAAFISRAVCNQHAETSELWESFRNGTLNLPCDKSFKMLEQGLPELTSLEEELADGIIRLLDVAKRLNVDIDRAVYVKHAFNSTRPYRHGGKAA